MAIGFPTNPIDKKSFLTGKKFFEYNSALGTWKVATRPPVSGGSSTITDVSHALDAQGIFSNASKNIPVYDLETDIISLLNEEIGQLAYAKDSNKLYVWNGSNWFGSAATLAT